MKSKVYSLVFVFLMISCKNQKNNNSGLIALQLINQNSNQDSTNKKEVGNIIEDVEVDFSGIDQNIYSVLAYKEKKDNSNSWINFSLSEEAKNEGWKEIPFSKKVKIEKGKKVEISLGGVVLLGEKKIDTKTNLTLVSVMGSEQKVRNFKYLALSLSSKKSGKLEIKTSDFENLKNKKVDFEKSYEAFKKEAVIVEVLKKKIAAKDQEVIDYGKKVQKKDTKKKKPNKEKDKPKPTRFERYEDKAVIDNEKNLVWQDMLENIGQNVRDPNAYIKWDAAKNKCDGLVIGKYKNWRFPTVEELEELHKYIEDNFQYVETKNYWTSKKGKFVDVLPGAYVVRLCVRADKGNLARGCKPPTNRPVFVNSLGLRANYRCVITK